MAKQKRRITLTLDPALVKRVDRMAKATRESRSAVVEDLLRDGLEDQEMFVKAMGNPLLRESLGRAFASKDVLRQMAAVIGDDLGDDQLELFTRMMDGFASPSSNRKRPAPTK